MECTLKITVLLLFAFFFGLDSTGQDYLPSSTTNQIVKHTYYTLSYSEDHEQAEWVAYKLTNAMIPGNQSRTDNFRTDPKVNSGSAALEDYKGSGYDSGHLCPAGDMTISHTAMSESFFMSNMSPQDPSFNRGIWKKLESSVRYWAELEEEIYLVTGPVFSENIGSIEPNDVTVPGYYYKVVFDNTGERKMIGFILPNTKGIFGLEHYAVSVDEVENETGIDFIPSLPDEEENELESNISTSSWVFTSTSTSSNSASKSSTITSSSSVQCKGKAKSTGQRCKNKTKNANGYCCPSITITRL